MKKLWTVKYKPKNLGEVVDQTEAKEKLLRWFKNWKPGGKAALLYGPPGNGKTCTVEALALEKGLDLLETNASDVRSENKIERFLGRGVKEASLFKVGGKIVLVDEVDGLAGNEDRGGISALVGLIKRTGFPVICTANDAWDSKLSSLRSVCNLVAWNSPNYLSINKLLRNILEKEGVVVDDTVTKSIARRCGGDVRAAVTDLQGLAVSSQLSKDGVDSVDDRAQTETMFNALIKILKSSDPLVALGALDAVSEDLNQSLLWIEENLPLEYRGKELADAFDKLSRADVFLGRIRRWQHWRFMVYAHDLITAGVAVSKYGPKRGFTKYQPPKRILKYWMAKKNKELRRSVAQKFSKVIHCSARKANAMLPYLRLFVKNGVDVSFLELSGEELDWLRNG